MKERGKKTVMEQKNDDVSEFSCRKHPSVSVVGICQFCLNDRLVNLICSECGERRLSSCSCSDFSSNAAVDVARISSLIDEETTAVKDRKTEKVLIFKRSNSSCVEIKKKNHKLSKFGRFFKKINLKKEKDFGDDKKIDSWVLDYKKLGVSRSRSLCSFRGNGYFIGSEEDGSSYSGARSSLSAARSSSVNGGLGIYEMENRKSNFEGRKSNFSETENRKSNFEGRKSNFSEKSENRKSNFSESEPPRRSCFEPPRSSNFSESEPPRRSCFEPPRSSNFSETEYNRKGNIPTAAEQHRKSDTAAMNFTRRVFSMKESYFTGGEETGFIDLKFDSSVMINDGVLGHGGGGSCRLTTKDREMQKSRRSFKGWKWIFGHHRD